jgi:hypothetical protein
MRATLVTTNKREFGRFEASQTSHRKEVVVNDAE